MDFFVAIDHAELTPKMLRRDQAGPQQPDELSAMTIEETDRKLTKKEKPGVVVVDTDPNRVCNPICDIPFEEGSNAQVHSSELYVHPGLVFGKMDTFPLSFYAQFLGFQVDPEAPARFPVGINIDGLKIDNSLPAIPPLGSTISRWRARGGLGENKDDNGQNENKNGNNQQNGMMHYVDPVYESLCSTDLTDQEKLKAAAIPDPQRRLSAPCLRLAKECMGIRTADYKIRDGLEYRVLNRDHVIAYQFVWFHLGKQDGTKPPVIGNTMYGMPSAASSLRKPRVSELVFHINRLERWDHKPATGKKQTRPTQTDALQNVETAKNKERTSAEGSAERSKNTLASETDGQHANQETRPSEDQVMPTSLRPAHGLLGGLPSESASSQMPVVPSMPVSNVASEGTASNAKDDVADKSHTGNKPTAPAQHMSSSTNNAGKGTNPFSVSRHEQLDERATLVLTALALEHARNHGIWYGIVKVRPALSRSLIKYFRMSVLPSSPSEDGSVMLVCDLKQCSYRYAFFLFRNSSLRTTQSNPTETTRRDGSTLGSGLQKQRLIVRLPNNDEVRSILTGVPTFRKAARVRRVCNYYSGVGPSVRGVSFGIRFTDEQGLLFVDGNDPAHTKSLPSKDFGLQPHWDILKHFPVPPTNADDGASRPDEILSRINKARTSLGRLERGLEAKARRLMQDVVAERIEFEKQQERDAEGERLIGEYEGILERRKEMDMAWQKQRDQDMDAVCDICNDGEVTPDNQILFCEACNVAVHQKCYGIERVPEGDYYCIACRYFDRETMGLAMARRTQLHGGEMKLAPSPLPIVCELCPRKQGAFIRTATPRPRLMTNISAVDSGAAGRAPSSKWVHVVCAKWHGLNFVDPESNGVVEDVRELKWSFVREGLRCFLCDGNRGAFNQCRAEGCKRWMHVTCARALGTCQVVHGENCFGPVGLNPWTLLCPEHSGIPEEEVPENSTTIEELVATAKQFPPETLPKGRKPRPTKPFHKMNGKERRSALSDPEYEREVLAQIGTKLQGVRCEVCHTVEEDGAALITCIECGIIFCESCHLPNEVSNSREFICAACEYQKRQEEHVTDEQQDPVGGQIRTGGSTTNSLSFVRQAIPGAPKPEKVVKNSQTGRTSQQALACCLCPQKGGWLRKAFGKPMKKSIWSGKQENFRKSLFGRDIWCHVLCAM